MNKFLTPVPIGYSHVLYHAVDQSEMLSERQKSSGLCRDSMVLLLFWILVQDKLCWIILLLPIEDASARRWSSPIAERVHTEKNGKNKIL